MPEREDYIKSLIGRARPIHPQIIPDVTYDSLCWVGPSAKSWSWTIPDDGFKWHIVSFTGSFYPTALIFGELLVDSAYIYRYAGLYSWELRYERKRAPVVDADSVLEVSAVNFSGSKKCLYWAVMYHREPM